MGPKRTPYDGGLVNRLNSVRRWGRHISFGDSWTNRRGRIVNGLTADYGEWPWQVSLRQWRTGNLIQPILGILFQTWLYGWLDFTWHFHELVLVALPNFSNFLQSSHFDIYLPHNEKSYFWYTPYTFCFLHTISLAANLLQQIRCRAIMQLK